MSSNLAIYLAVCRLPKKKQKKKYQKAQKQQCHKSKILMGWGFWNDTAAQTACEYLLLLHGVDSHTIAFLGNAFCHSYAHFYIPPAVISIPFGLS